jgi:hypothetical protein
MPGGGDEDAMAGGGDEDAMAGGGDEDVATDASIKRDEDSKRGFFDDEAKAAILLSKTKKKKNELFLKRNLSQLLEVIFRTKLNLKK